MFEDEPSLLVPYLQVKARSKSVGDGELEVFVLPGAWALGDGLDLHVSAAPGPKKCRPTIFNAWSDLVDTLVCAFDFFRWDTQSNSPSYKRSLSTRTTGLSSCLESICSSISLDSDDDWSDASTLAAAASDSELSYASDCKED